ncbi:DNA-processing protein DprA [Romeria aff. gracilis LEGE 07310]|uniref:DNA-processing protein DprA n=1 Tax=Vasconcelosia minhoensis LEGE 07310 TaxID=915328 RepID=A0A8J7A5Y7_9CYAN|nr:DNA-processing protein DprA [Romeria gracilis]MBE9077162.1 DNA-processing protein DprA [Romeria aff. gracilis LEGE 07310]
MLQAIALNASHPAYPKALSPDWSDSPPTLSAIGNLGLLQQPTLALFCSVQCPGDLILQTYDLARSLRDAGIATVSGFHSPMEKECLRLLLRGTQPVIYCPARSLEKMRLKDYEMAVERDRVLILSPFQGNQHRMTAALAQRRNRFVAALANAVFIAYATPESKTEALARQVIAWNKPLLTFASSDNQNLLNLGAQPIEPCLSRARWS